MVKNKLKTHIINYKQVFNDVKITANDAHISEYLNGGRQDILDNFDIFCENVRSNDTENKNFDLFDIVDDIDSDTIVVVGFYLELLEFWGQRENIKMVCDYYCKKYINNKVIVTWNHDTNASNVFNFIDEYENLYVLNFNTDKKHDRYILLPFWTIDDRPLNENKKYLANLVCAFNNNIRRNLKTSLGDNSNILISEKIEFSEYRKTLSSSLFTLCPKGLGLSSYRFFEAFHLNTIPVLFADNVILPYENDIDYSKIIIRIPEDKASDGEFIITLLNSVNQEEMLTNIRNARLMFTLKGVQEKIYKTLI